MRGSQMATSGSKFSPFTTVWSQGSKSSHQVWWQVPLLAELHDGSGSMVVCVRAHRWEYSWTVLLPPMLKPPARRGSGCALSLLTAACQTLSATCKRPHSATSVCIWESRWVLRSPCGWLMSSFPLWPVRALVFSPRTHLSLRKTLLSHMESCFVFTVSLFLNSVAFKCLVYFLSYS